MTAFYQATYRWIGGLFIVIFLQGCAGTPQTDRLLSQKPAELMVPHELTQVPFFAQQAYQCGPAALATLLQHQSLSVQPDDLIDRIYLPQRKGSLQVEIVSATREYGLIPYLITPELDTLLKEVKAGRPVLVLQNLGVSWYPKWHYAVVIGYDLPAEKLILRSGVIKRYVMDLHTFEYTWRRSQSWAMLALNPGELPVDSDPWRYLKSIVGFEYLKRWDILDSAYLAGLARWPKNRELLMGYGTSQYLQQRLDIAHFYFSHVILSHPQYAPAHNNLAQVLAEQGDISTALHHAQRAVELGGVHIEQYQSTLNEIIDKHRQ